MMVLVTGGFGYLGGRIIQALLARPGVDVRVLAHGDRPPPTGFPSSVEIRRGNVMDAESLRGICEGVTYVVHLAGLDQATCRKSPADGLLFSAIGTLRMAEEAAANRVRRFLYVSTIHVYGTPQADLLLEETPLKPINPYGASRAAGEVFARMVSQQRELSVVILRLSNGYGPPAYPNTGCWNLVVNNLCRQAVRCGRIVLRGTGNETRNFVAVSDIVQAVELFAAIPHAELGEGIFNIGGERARTILEVAQCVRDVFAEMSGWRVPLQRGASPVPEMPMPHLNIARARACGYAPQTEFRDEVRRTLKAAGGRLGENQP